jgi:hypothetical protein
MPIIHQTEIKMAIREDYTVDRASKFDIELTTTIEGVPLSLSSAVITFKAAIDYDTPPIIDMSSADPDAIEITNSDNGQFTVHLSEDDTNITISFPTNYVYDIRVSYENESAIVQYGTLTILPRLT